MEKMLEHRINEYEGAHALYMQKEDDAIRQKLASKGMLNSGVYIRERLDLFNKLLVGFTDSFGQERPSVQDFYAQYFSDFPEELTAEVVKEIVDRQGEQGRKISQYFPSTIQHLPNNEAIKNSWSNSVQASYNKAAQQIGMKLSVLLKKNAQAIPKNIGPKQTNRGDRLSEIHDLIHDKSRPTLNGLIDAGLEKTAAEQSDIYQGLFLLENFLRRFIEKRLKEDLGPDYISKIVIPNETRNAISKRKKQESDHSWVRTRGESDLFYLDFNDLGYILKNNWTHFAKAFPEQQWIQVKIDELYKCRCLIAHNSMIGEHEADVIWTNSKSILLQLADK